MSYVDLTMHLWPSNYSVAIKGLSTYLATVQTIAVDLVWCSRPSQEEEGLDNCLYGTCGQTARIWLSPQVCNYVGAM